MSDILCRWLNEELRLSKTVEPKTFAKNFSNGYLIGEVLHKYQLQNDFSMFMKKDTSISKLNNFTRLEPTLHLLGISFDINTAQELMQEKQGVATRLLYQLYVSLENKKKAEISGTVMEIMQPAAVAGLHKKEHEIYSDRLHQVVKRDAELKLQKISQHYEEQYQQWNECCVVTHPIQQRRQLKVQDEKRMKNIEKLQVRRQKHNDIMTYNQAAIVQVPKPPPYTSQINLKRRQQQQRRTQQAQLVQMQIAQFETNRKQLITYGFASPSSGQPYLGDCPPSEVPGSGTKLILQSNSKYIHDIRQRLEENAAAREQREKRRDRFLVEQLKAHEAQEETRREEQLVKRLTRQTQQEQRLTAQLLQIRKQKEVIRENRLFRDQQCQQRRERDFQEALEREAALAQQAKLEGAEEIRKELEFCNRIAAERAQRRYKKHFTSCKDILEQIVDLATKVGEYRLLTGNLIPEKPMREWKELLFSGLPLYEPIKGQQPGFEFSTPLDPVELKKQEILKNQDYDEYTNMVGEWAWPEEAGEQITPTNNNILGHVVLRLRNIVHPPIVEPSSPSFPHFTLKACVLGKFCSGKTTCLSKIAEAHGIYVLSADKLIQEALNAYQIGEEVKEQQEERDSEQLLTSPRSPTSLKPDLDTQEESRNTNIRLSTRAMQGEAAEKELRKGSILPNELLVDIIVEAIRQVPAQSGWILDGFPVDITQAHLLEKALGGSVEVEYDIESSRMNLAVDPNPPSPPPPPAPVLDLALLLDIPDECVVRRAFSQMDADTTAAKTSHPTDKNLYLAQIPHRITAFQDTWPKLEKWFSEKQNILIRVDADVEEEELCKRVESVLQELVMQTQEALATPPVADVVLDSGKAPDSSSSDTPAPVDQAPVLTDEAPVPTHSYSSLNEDKAQSVTSLSKSNTHSPREHSRKVSASSVNNEDSQENLKNPPHSASPYPGSPSWVYVDEPLPPEIPEYLYPHWDTVTESYVNNIKTVMQQLRSQRNFINHHLFNIREEYKHYLVRPDLKQELVSQWQKDFNSIPDDMREDEDTKAELHLRLDELRESLWDISDKRKEEDEQERAALMGWLEDHIAILINNHSILIQVELERFHDTLCILRVYYLSMYRPVPPELPSNFVCIPLLDPSEIKDKDESAEPAGSQVDDGEDKRKTRKSHTDSGRVSKTTDQGQTEPAKVMSPQEKLISDYEEALTAISKLVSAEAHQGETKEHKEKLQDKDKAKASASANKKEKGKQSSKKQKGMSFVEHSEKLLRGPPSPPPAPSPPLADNPQESHHQEVKNKIHKEFAAALNHEENAAKVRIALVKGHGLVTLQSLQSRAEQTFSSMKKWLETHYLAEMKSIDQLSEVVRHHIEAGAKLQNQLLLECTDFFLNGDCHMVASPAPPPRPPPLEKPTGSTPTITQLETLHQQLRTVAPSGLMSSFEFSSLLRDITSLNTGRKTLPDPWIDKNETQLMEIESLLTDEYELIDWRRFLLSAALPWPFPSLTQLLVVLQRFKAADTGYTGYINEEQYLQTELWFSSETVPPVPEDPSEPLPYDRLTNLRKFFFQLFADYSFSPPQLDYVSMLQYFAADPNPRQGFIRALTVVVGQHLKHSSPGHLVESMPSIEEATDLSSSEGKYKEEETPYASSGSEGEQKVSIAALLAVICHKVTKMKDDIPLPPGCLSPEEHTEHLVHVFRELGYNPEDCVPFSVLSEHPFIRGLMDTSAQYHLVNIHRLLLAHQDEGEANSLTVS
ncbi:LOW QUALITY PROTEIN: sperm flagellar protein 2 [Micropterus salmoides]|uniref:LOW QUALITY PROTEIN: sperm flagellar protein 2 n=1 Tax=Micropterus salmoides TaxID=27706 RepID=UPI0018EB4690|nr:LOW QUALITY PROTEIN: sperm flagellar protein 2 [Micropterus salmoides]